MIDGDDEDDEEEEEDAKERKIREEPKVLGVSPGSREKVWLHSEQSIYGSSESFNSHNI